MVITMRRYSQTNFDLGELNGNVTLDETSTSKNVIAPCGIENYKQQRKQKNMAGTHHFLKWSGSSLNWLTSSLPCSLWQGILLLGFPNKNILEIRKLGANYL
jgi:hypothetical protein